MTSHYDINNFIALLRKLIQIHPTISSSFKPSDRATEMLCLPLSHSSSSFNPFETPMQTHVFFVSLKGRPHWQWFPLISGGPKCKAWQWRTQENS